MRGQTTLDTYAHVLPRHAAASRGHARQSPTLVDQIVIKTTETAGFLYLNWGLGWMTGFEPATSGATVRRSTAELHPPHGREDRTGAEDHTAWKRLV